MQNGGQAAEQVVSQQQSVDPAIQQISDFISQAISQGQNPAEVVMSLVEQQVDQQTIGQALMMNGFEENDIMALFQEMGQGQQPEEGAGGEPDTIGELNRTPEELTEDERMHADTMSVEETNEAGMSMGKSGIEIKPENEGKFTRWAQARGMSVQEAASKVMSNKDEYPPAVVKMANFAKNAAGWNKEYGGESYEPGGEFQGKVSRVNNVNVKKDMNWQKAPLYMNPMEYEYSNDNFSLGKVGALLYGGYKEFLSGEDKNKDGVKDGFFRDGSKKAGIRDATKGNYYNYKITQDPNDPNRYVADNMDLYNASKNQGNLRTIDQYGKDVLDNSRFNYDVDTNKYDVIRSSRPIDERIYNSASNKNALAGKDYNYLREFIGDKNTREMLLGSLNDPEQGLLSIDEYGKVSSTVPGKFNPNEYNTYMGINRLGANKPTVSQNQMIPTKENGQPAAGMINNSATIVPAMSQQTNYKLDSQAVANSQLQKRYPGLGPTPEQQNYNYDITSDDRFKYGGNLDKAQFGPPDWLSGTTDENKTYDLQNLNNFFKSMTQTNYAQDTQAVADAQLEKQKATSNTIPMQQQTPGIVDIGDSSNLIEDEATVFGIPASESIASKSPSFESPSFQSPKVERTNKFEGGLNRFMDSPGVRGYEKLSNFAVLASGIGNDLFRDKNINQAREDNFNKLGADYQYATAEDPFNKRGMWDVNTGTAGSEGDRTVGLYISKYGGENNTVNVDSNLLAKLIAAGADIEIL